MNKEGYMKDASHDWNGWVAWRAIPFITEETAECQASKLREEGYIVQVLKDDNGYVAVVRDA